MSNKLKIMLVDDHYLVRMGLASIIALESDMTVCAEAATGEQALALFRIHNPDVTLIDQRLPGMTGSETTQKIRAEYPGARILVLSTYACDEEIYRALQCGAMGYLSKSVQREELTQAIRKAASGRRHITPEVATLLAEGMSRSRLSTRELDVLRLLAEGRSTKEIARTLELGPGTVKIHLAAIFRALNAHNRTEAVVLASRLSL